MTNRREFLSKAGHMGLGALVVGAFGADGLRSGAHAQTAGRTLIKVFMRGGADGMNLFPPYTENAYYQSRPNIAVAPPNGSDPAAAIRLTNAFGMHPALAPLQEIWDDGNMALSLATHRDGLGRSHFDNQRWIEQGVVGLSASGFLGRYLVENQQTNAVLQALATGRSSPPVSIIGGEPVVSIRRVSDFAIENSYFCEGTDCSENHFHDVLARLYDTAPPEASSAELIAYESGRKLSAGLETFEQFSGDYTPSAGGLEYSSSDFGSGLKVLAQVIKANIGLEIATIDWNVSWDTHSGQLPAGQSHADLNFGYHQRINQGASDIVTFYRDIATHRNDVAMVFGSEFGRSVKENGSRGTDHGAAAAWFAIGGAVNGGIRGDWPGLAENQLQDGRFLAHTIDYRDVMSEALTRFLGAPDSQLGAIFPDFAPTDRNIFLG